MNTLVRKNLMKVISPVLIVHSTNDQVSIKENIQIIQSKISSTDIKILEVNKAHHSVFDTSPDLEEIFAAVDKFIQK
jgi:esterase/lipase